MNIIFLDIDGVLNCELFFNSRIKNAKKVIKQNLKDKTIDRFEYYKEMICPDRMDLFNDLCVSTNSKVVISSSWRIGKSLEEMKEIMTYCGGTFDIIGLTPRLGYERGIEISKWIKDNINMETCGCHYYDFYNYIIIDDDSDMLLNQREHFFNTDYYSGLTHNTCYRIKRYFNKFK